MSKTCIASSSGIGKVSGFGGFNVVWIPRFKGHPLGHQATHTSEAFDPGGSSVVR
jgi:hypothetical protein